MWADPVKLGILETDNRRKWGVSYPNKSGLLSGTPNKDSSFIFYFQDYLNDYHRELEKSNHQAYHFTVQSSRSMIVFVSRINVVGQKNDVMQIIFKVHHM